MNIQVDSDDSFDEQMDEESDEEYGARKKKKKPAKNAAVKGKAVEEDADNSEPFVPPPVPAGMIIKAPKEPKVT